MKEKIQVEEYIFQDVSKNERIQMLSNNAEKREEFQLLTN